MKGDHQSLIKTLENHEKIMDHAIPPKNMITMPYKTYAFTNVADLADLVSGFSCYMFLVK